MYFLSIFESPPTTCLVVLIHELTKMLSLLLFTLLVQQVFADSLTSVSKPVLSSGVSTNSVRSSGGPKTDGKLSVIIISVTTTATTASTATTQVSHHPSLLPTNEVVSNPRPPTSQVSYHPPPLPTNEIVSKPHPPTAYKPSDSPPRSRVALKPSLPTTPDAVQQFSAVTVSVTDVVTTVTTVVVPCCRGTPITAGLFMESHVVVNGESTINAMGAKTIISTEVTTYDEVVSGTMAQTLQLSQTAVHVPQGNLTYVPTQSQTFDASLHSANPLVESTPSAQPTTATIPTSKLSPNTLASRDFMSPFKRDTKPLSCKDGPKGDEYCRQFQFCNHMFNNYAVCQDDVCVCLKFTCDSPVETPCPSSKHPCAEDDQFLCLPQYNYDGKKMCQCRPKKVDCLLYPDPHAFCRQNLNCTGVMLSQNDSRTDMTYPNFAQCATTDWWLPYPMGRCSCRDIGCPVTDEKAGLALCKKMVDCPKDKKPSCERTLPEDTRGRGLGYCKCV